jgi:hypothetical protein
MIKKVPRHIVEGNAGCPPCSSSTSINSNNHINNSNHDNTNTGTSNHSNDNNNISNNSSNNNNTTNYSSSTELVADRLQGIPLVMFKRAITPYWSELASMLNISLGQIMSHHSYEPNPRGHAGALVNIIIGKNMCVGELEQYLQILDETHNDANLVSMLSLPNSV